jgi:hypothetical protein
MALLVPNVYDGQVIRKLSPGDLLAGAEVLPATIATQNTTVTGAQLALGLVNRSAGAAGTDTLDSAANILAAMSGGVGNVGIQAGTTFRCRWIQTAAFAITVAATANTGVTVALPTVNASSVKEFLFTWVNGTPATTVLGTTVNASAVVSGFTQAQLAGVTVGMIVTNAVAGLQGTTVIAVNAQTGQLTFSGNANATNATAVAINLSPVLTCQGIGQGLI